MATMMAGYRELARAVDGVVNCGGVQVGYELVRSKRRTFGVDVHPGGRVVVRVPFAATMEQVEAWVAKRASWIARQLDYFERHGRRKPEYQYVDGERHLYLGRKYRLKILPDDEDDVRLRNGYFHIRCSDQSAEHIRDLLEKWYRSRAEVYLPRLFAECYFRFDKCDLPPPPLKIRALKTCWGSCSLRKGITLNSILIQAERDCIEYIIFHELCHLVHLNHNREFYRLMTEHLPDWKERKRKLEMALL